MDPLDEHDLRARLSFSSTLTWGDLEMELELSMLCSSQAAFKAPIYIKYMFCKVTNLHLSGCDLWLIIFPSKQSEPSLW